MNKKYLAGLSILVTRPSPDGETFCELVRAAGGNATHFPTLEIMAEPISISVDFDWLIFISPQAVRMSIDRLIFKNMPKLAAIGPGTARTLAEFEFAPILFPTKNPSAKALLELPELQQIKNLTFGLVQGQNGRPELFDTLTARGAKVKKIIAYRRTCPTPKNLTKIQQLFAENKIDVIIINSSDSLRNLLNIIGNCATAQRSQLTLIVSSQAQFLAAQAIGFEKILLAENPGHDAIMSVLEKWHRTKNYE